ncbi:MAG: type II secretion system F family protein [Isosphaeraceae bacterium]
MTLDQLIALNDEIVALTRAGMPLESGLMGSSHDLPGRLRSITAAVAQRMERGEGLSEALDGLGAGEVPPVYRAVVDAGIRSGRLPTALEGLAGYARGYSEARHAIGLALWYPLIVLCLAYALFILLMAFVLPKFEAVLRDFNLPIHSAFAWLVWLGTRTALFWWVGPVLLLVALGLWLASGRAAGLGRTGRRELGFFRWVPWFGRMMRCYEAASCTETLALPSANGVPYPEALRLSGRASSDPDLAEATESMARTVERGEPILVPPQGARPCHRCCAG